MRKVKLDALKDQLKSRKYIAQDFLGCVIDRMAVESTFPLEDVFVDENVVGPTLPAQIVKEGVPAPVVKKEVLVKSAAA